MSHTVHLYLSRILLTTLLVLLGAAPLAAGESRWYLDAKLGQGSLDAQLGTRWPKKFEGHDETGSVEVGFILNRYLAVQAGYHDLGEYRGFGPSCSEDDDVCPAYGWLADDGSLVLCVEGATDPICRAPAIIVPMVADVSGFSLSLVPRWPLLDDRLAVYGKIGVIGWDSDVAIDFGFGTLEDFSDRDLLSGLGVRYYFRKGLGVLVEYQRLGFGHDSTKVGASWRF